MSKRVAGWMAVVPGVCVDSDSDNDSDFDLDFDFESLRVPSLANGGEG
jgi:hypothetical protein